MDKELRKAGRKLDAVMQVGKGGITQGIIDQLDHELEQRELVKVKLLKSATESLDRKEAAKDLARHTDSEVVDVVGGAIVLYRKR